MLGHITGNAKVNAIMTHHLLLLTEMEKMPMFLRIHV